MNKKGFFEQITQAFTTRSDGKPAPAAPGSAQSMETLQRENLRLKRGLEELSMLNELAREISSSRNADAVMDRIIRRSLKAVHAEQAVVTLVTEQTHEAGKTLVRAMVTSAEHEQFHLNQNLLGWMHLNKKPLLANSPRTDERFRGITWDPSIQSIVCVPLMVKSKLIGVLTAYNKKDGGEFTDDDQRVLAIIAMQSAQVVENARLYEEEQAYMHIQEEVRLAAVIQMELLPGEAPRLPGYDVAGKSIPAQQVGGDYFDFIPIENRGMAVCLGDVSGKGLPASLLMANLQATLRGQTLLDVPPSVCIRRSNELLFRSTDPEKFATLFYGVLNTKDHQLSFSNAGHENPFLFSRDGELIRLATGGTVLGVVDNFPFEEDTIPFNPGDLLVIFSDGITEAWDAVDTQYGEERLAEVIREHRDVSATDLTDRIIESVKEHAGSAPQADDLTLVVIKRDAA